MTIKVCAYRAMRLVELEEIKQEFSSWKKEYFESAQSINNFPNIAIAKAELKPLLDKVSVLSKRAIFTNFKEQLEKLSKKFTTLQSNMTPIGLKNVESQAIKILQSINALSQKIATSPPAENENALLQQDRKQTSALSKNAKKSIVVEDSTKSFLLTGLTQFKERNFPSIWKQLIFEKDLQNEGYVCIACIIILMWNSNSEKVPFPTIFKPSFLAQRTSFPLLLEIERSSFYDELEAHVSAWDTSIKNSLKEVVEQYTLSKKVEQLELQRSQLSTLQQTSSNSMQQRKKTVDYAKLLEMIVLSSVNIDSELQRYALELPLTSLSVSLGLVQLIEDKSIHNSTVEELQNRLFPSTAQRFRDLYKALNEQLNTVLQAVTKFPKMERDNLFSWLNDSLRAPIPRDFSSKLTLPMKFDKNFLSDIEWQVDEREIGALTEIDGKKSSKEVCEAEDALNKGDFAGTFNILVEAIDLDRHKIYHIILQKLTLNFIKDRSYNIAFLMLRNIRKEYKEKHAYAFIFEFMKDDPELAHQVAIKFISDASYQKSVMDAIQRQKDMNTTLAVRNYFSSIFRIWYALNVSLSNLSAGQRKECGDLLEPIKNGTFFKDSL